MCVSLATPCCASFDARLGLLSSQLQSRLIRSVCVCVCARVFTQVKCLQGAGRKTSATLPLSDLIRYLHSVIGTHASHTLTHTTTSLPPPDLSLSGPNTAARSAAGTATANNHPLLSPLPGHTQSVVSGVSGGRSGGTQQGMELARSLALLSVSTTAQQQPSLSLLGEEWRSDKPVTSTSMGRSPVAGVSALMSAVRADEAGGGGGEGGGVGVSSGVGVGEGGVGGGARGDRHTSTRVGGRRVRGGHRHGGDT